MPPSPSPSPPARGGRGFRGPSDESAPVPLLHLMNTGLGPFYDGLAHLFVTPEDLLPVLALALLSGLRGPRFGRASLFVLPSAWLLGTIVGRLFHPHSAWPILSAVLTIAFGALVAADRPLPLAAVAALAAALGLWNGAWNGIELARARAGMLGNALGDRVRGLRRGGDLRGLRGVGAGAVGPDRDARGGQLDRRRRALHARLVAPARLNATRSGASVRRSRPGSCRDWSPRSNRRRPSCTRTPSSCCRSSRIASVPRSARRSSG